MKASLIQLSDIMLVTIAVLMMFALATILIGGWQKKIPYQTCGASMIAAKLSTIVSGDRATPILCDRNYITFDKEKTKEIQKQTAEAIYKCAMIGYESQGWAGAPFLTETLYGDTLCVMCSVISFKNKQEKTIPLEEYLATKQIPGRGMSYTEYLDSLYTQNKFQVWWEPELQQNKEYAIYIRGVKMQSVIKWSEEKLRNHFGNTERVENAVLLDPIEQLQECETILN